MAKQPERDDPRFPEHPAAAGTPPHPPPGRPPGKSSENPPGKPAPPSVAEATAHREAYLADMERENAELRAKLGMPARGAEPPQETGPTVRALVSFPDSHVADVEVGIPADTPAEQREAAAIAAAQRKAGIWSAPSRPVVTFPDDKK